MPSDFWPSFSEFDCGTAEPNGFFPDPEQCDLYYECVDGVATPNLCPDGLMFDDTDSIEAKCDYPFYVECRTRGYLRKLIKNNFIFNNPNPLLILLSSLQILL